MMYKHSWNFIIFMIRMQGWSKIKTIDIAATSLKDHPCNAWTENVYQPRPNFFKLRPSSQPASRCRAKRRYP